jgi:hypothetical protein
MKVHTRVVIDIASGAVLEDDWYEYEGPVASCDPGTIISGGAAVLGINESRKASKRASRAADAQTAAINRQMDLAEDQWQRYLDVYGPLEEELVGQVSGDDYLTAAYERLDDLEAQQGEILDDLGGRLDTLESESRLDPDAEAGRAAADVAQSFGLQREAEARRRARYAVDPTSGAAVDADMRLNLNQAKARGLAKNLARRQAEDINFQRGSALYSARAGLGGTRIAALNDNFLRRTGVEDADVNRKLAVHSIGKGLPATAASGFRSAGSQAGDLARMHAADAAGAMRFGIDMGSRAMDWWNKRGGGAPTSTPPISPGLPGEDGNYYGFAEGGEVRGPGDGTSDSVPAVIDGEQPARLSDGEYVMSEQAVRWHGLKKLTQMNEEGRAATPPEGSGMGLPAGARLMYGRGGMVRGQGLRVVPRYARGGPIQATDPVARRHEIAKRLRAHGMGGY